MPLNNCVISLQFKQALLSYQLEASGQNLYSSLSCGDKV